MRTILVFFTCMISAFILKAQTYAISGTVKNADNKPLGGAQVILQPVGKTTTTNQDGFFAFDNLLPNTYSLTVESKDYTTQKADVVITDNHLIVDFLLHSSVKQLEEVIVSANQIQVRKKRESLNVEWVNQAFVQKHLGGSLMKTLERLPGISTIGIGSGQSKPLIRGMGFNRVVVVDKGVKHEGQQWGADHGLEIDQFAAGEIAIIKGAASFMYGSDAIGGIIDVKPAALPQQNTLEGSAEIIGKTNNNLYGSSLHLTGRKNNWVYGGRFTYQDYSDYRVPTDTVYVYSYAVHLDKKYVRNTAGREANFHLHTGYVGNRFSSVFYVSNTFSKSGFFANAHGLEPRNVNAAIHNASNRDVLMPHQQVRHFKLINSSSYKAGIHHWEMEIGYQHNFRQEHSQYVNHGYMPPVYPDTLRIPANLEREFNKRVYSIQLRDKISLGKHELSVGGNAEYQDNSIDGWSFLVPGFKQRAAGLFVYDKYRLNDRVYLHGALRYDYSRIQTFQYTDWFPSDIATGSVVYKERLVRAHPLIRHFNSVVWSAGINVNTDAFSLKANIGKSFRMPIAKEIAANGVNYHYFSYERGNPSLSPEESYQADITLGWQDEKWAVQISPFYNYFPNYIYLNPTPQYDYQYGAGNQVFEYTQSRIMRYGGEAQVKYRINKNLSTEIIGEYLYAEQLSGSKKGYTLPFSPPPSLLLNLTWTPEDKKTQKRSNTYVSLDYRLVARQHHIVPPEKKTPGYGIINMQAGMHTRLGKQPVEFSMQIQNVLNTRYLDHTSFYRLIELPELGRNLVLSIKLPFTFLKTEK